MKVKNRTSDPVTLQLLKLSARKKDAIVAACDAGLRYTHLFNPHPRFTTEGSIGKRDDELAPADHVAELVALKEEVVQSGREVRRRVHTRVGDEVRLYDVLAEPIHGDRGEVSGVATAAVDVTPTHDVQTLLRRVAERLEARVDGITERWHEALSYRLSVRPQSVFPTDELLDGAPAVVRWLAKSVVNGDDLAADDAESLREIAGHWRRGGYSIEESLVHVRVLSDLLLDALAAATDEEAGGGLRPSAGVEASRRLCRSLDVVKLIFVAAYRDEEETRFTDFGTTMAHEIRSHLGSALTAAELLDLLDPEEDEAKREDVRMRLRHALEQANQVVTSVHALSRASAESHAAWRYRPLDELVEEVVAHRDGGPHVRVEPDEGIPDARVPAEPIQLILHNLIDNAVKYANPDASTRWVKIHTERDSRDGHLVVHVGDNGLGVSEAEQERIFLRFRRGAEARGDGFGLGLAIVRETARQFGGRILLESEPGKGSTFSFTIPADQLKG